MATTQTVSRDPALEAHVFWLNHRREILMAIGVLVLVLLGYGGYWLYSERRDAAAAEALAKSHNVAEYQQVIARFDNTNAGATAYLLLAEAQRKEGKYTDSNATLQKFLEKRAKHELAPAARMAIAANLQSLGKNDEALAAYQRVAADYSKSYEAPLALIAQVPILKAKGQKDEARRACETVMSQYPQSIWANQAMQQLRELKPPGEGQAAPGLPGAPTLGGPKQGAPPPMLARPPAAAPPAGPPAPQTKPSAGKP